MTSDEFIIECKGLEKKLQENDISGIYLLVNRDDGKSTIALYANQPTEVMDNMYIILKALTSSFNENDMAVTKIKRTMILALEAAAKMATYLETNKED